MADTHKNSIKVKVPASTSNLGPGFDCLGLALQIYNIVETHFVDSNADSTRDPFLLNAANSLFQALGIPNRPFFCKIYGEIPPSRGLGSSVSVRLGLLLGLNRLLASDNQPYLSRNQIYQIAVKLEGHPDNAAPATYGGFTLCLPDGRFLRFPVSAELQIALAIPEVKTSTEEARQVIPPSFSRSDAIANLAFSSAIAAAFASGRYELLADLFHDRFHQPFRKKFNPQLDVAIEAGIAAGALGGWLSGSGSTIACATLSNGAKVAEAMAKAIGNNCKALVTHADNVGATILGS
ncbi:MAG: homoserine kinase [Chthoniobacterales bacterium]|nr:homoserine kinase [Chthoniobacterales bacterium]